MGHAIARTWKSALKIGLCLDMPPGAGVLVSNNLARMLTARSSGKSKTISLLQNCQAEGTTLLGSKHGIQLHMYVNPRN